MKILGIDYGTAKVGLAMGDSESGLATPLEIIKNKSINNLLNKILEITEKEGIEKIVIGLPFNPQTKSNEQIERTESFAKKLEQATEVDIDFEDERFTTSQAQGLNSDGDEDDLAAMLILQAYLDRN